MPTDAADCTNPVLAAERDEARTLTAEHVDDPPRDEACPNRARHNRIGWCGACQTWAGRR